MSSMISGQVVHGAYFGWLYSFINNNSKYNKVLGAWYWIGHTYKALGASFWIGHTSKALDASNWIGHTYKILGSWFWIGHSYLYKGFVQYKG